VKPSIAIVLEQAECTCIHQALSYPETLLLMYERDGGAVDRQNKFAVAGIAAGTGMVPMRHLISSARDALNSHCNANPA